jgi:hypothetical protein
MDHVEYEGETSWQPEFLPRFSSLSSMTILHHLLGQVRGRTAATEVE